MATMEDCILPVKEESKKKALPDFEDDSGLDNTSESGRSCDDDLKTDFSSTESINMEPSKNLSCKLKSEDIESAINLGEVSIKIEDPKPSLIIAKAEDTLTELPKENEKIDFEKLPDYFKDLLIGKNVSFIHQVSFADKPSWYDEEKFKKGQKFAIDHLFCLNYAESISLFMIFALKSALDPLVFTDKSNTPYKAFERYLSTLTRVISWYKEDPWQESSTSQRNITAVRLMHRNVQTKLKNCPSKELQNQITLTGRCPMWNTSRSTVLDDFKASCPVPAPDSFPFATDRGAWVNQYDMAITQLAFVGLVVAYPNNFGIHRATPEDLEGFLHLWRTLGYLLGIEDKYNYCNADLETVRQRTYDFINFAIKPSFRDVTPEWEHMSRCLVRGVAFYVPGFTFEVSLAYLCSVLKIHMPRLTKSLSMWESFMLRAVDFTFNGLCRIPGLLTFYNFMMMRSIKRAQDASPETLRKWEQTEFPYMKNEDNNNKLS